ncbi:UNVERIFIED_ORG: Ni/Co efflux regulator RcnB [Methylobacterium sp. SuP10 SLI 274]|uniref:hypothetical protein n=1 Tax=Methylorubrum extorquens TaxID=408 RepID=UPI00209FF28F|nr:hypothetical protein [Methylorubrum extorquens]MDF9862693.1 Ni/Co efflux regulator RcnB [Methylorubrum pseudosasae]MDH6636305.1 Ni/Co efflux regulator RcnB [Methylobacterium sp. SuP10 SLI 274]MDH6665480.1 Ni/Co efflux regulator RcnB [Methylorubrum zatmanii]MCP1557402.1 Ni/Co efflux regulator RcnB [Methylorubrum extorquens]MDF9790987.1 Ni/Co efflux regulator RcnB [Methylorubrum extorquens]
MFTRLLAAALLAAPLLLAQAATAKEAWNAPSAKETAKETAKEQTAKEPSVAQSAARERQKKCGAEWRALSATEKTAQGPKWPQYYSKCVKRLKEQKA